MGFGKLDLSKCDSLAPQLTNCISAHLIRIGYHSGGSIGWLGSYYIFGIFESNKDCLLYTSPSPRDS